MREQLEELVVSRDSILHRPISQQRPSRLWKWVGIACLILGLFFAVWRGPMPLEALLHKMALDAQAPEGAALALNPSTLRHFYSLSSAIIFLLAAAVCFGVLLWPRVTEKIRAHLFDATFTLTMSCFMMLFLTLIETDSPWMPLSMIMRHPTYNVVFAHRLLFIGLARVFEMLHPGLSDLRSFYLTQWLASLLALYVLGRWSAMFLGRSLAWCGQILGVVLMTFMFDYYNFYDIATVFFSTCGLMAIMTRRYWWLVPIVLVGTANYEGPILLILVAVFVAYKEPWKTWVPPVAVSFVAYYAVRFSYQKFVPVPFQQVWRTWTNMSWTLQNLGGLMPRIVVCLLLLALGVMCFMYCSARLKRMTLLFLLNWLTSFAFGRINEVRLFEACTPLLIGMILSAAAWRLRFEREQGPLIPSDVPIGMQPG